MAAGSSICRVILASANRGKLRELEVLLAPLGWELIAQQQLGVPPAVESGATFLENALIKARHASAAAALPALADDSGIEVAALGGRPGVRSARYAGEHASDRENLQKLLQELRGVAPEQRRARYRCVIAYVRSATDPRPLIAEGQWEGTLAAVPRGTGGFGYDPIFVPRGESRTAAELAPAEKDAVSHRAQALSSLLHQLRSHDTP
ncbi:MAG TPA: RdgB/HAM1 family non-canonical purine NTP pyrophosphatase [Steroidobacteraceae bacterium]|nr:RdgB/HAM1 family non-canonical purine NTP pyrophosphatase [Steroidobacteraceae bacterium]